MYDISQMETGRQSTKNDRIISRNIRDMRISSGMTLKEAAAALGVTYQQVQKYENGKNRLSAGMLVKLKRLYDAAYDDFFSGVQEGGYPAPAPLTNGEIIFDL